MRTARTVTIVALVAAAVGLTALAPTAFAQNAPAAVPGTPPAPGADAPGMMMPGQPGMGMQRHGMRPGMPFMANRMMMGNRGPGGLLELGCAPNAAEAIDVRLLRLSYRLGLTDAQKPLFQKLHDDAIAAVTSYGESCKTLMPQPGAARPDMIQGLQDRLKLDQARIDATTKLIPDLQALFATLTDTQKADLQPRMMMRPGMPGGMWPGHQGPGMHGKGMPDGQGMQDNTSDNQSPA